MNEDYSKSVSMERFIPMTREEILEAFTKTLDRALSMKDRKVMLSFNIGLHENPETTVGTALRLDTPSYMTLVANMLSIPLIHGDITSAEAAVIPHMAVRMARQHGAQE